MAVRRELFSELGLFRTDLDRKGDEVLAAGETELIDRIAKAGWKVVYTPDARVSHSVTADRLEKSYLFKIGRGLAASHVILTSEPTPRKVLRWLASDTWYAMRMFCRLAVAILLRKDLWFDDYMRFWMVAMRLPIRLTEIFRVETFLR